MGKQAHVTPAMNPDKTKDRHVNPATNQFSILPYILLITVIVLGMSILLYYNNTNSTIYTDPVDIDDSIEKLA